MNEHNEPLRFNTKKHDKKVQSKLGQETRATLLVKAKQIYYDWMQELKGKARGNELTKADIVPAFYQLRERVGALVKGNKDMEAWMGMTCTAIEDMIVRALTKEIADRNEIEQYVPNLGFEWDGPSVTGLVLTKDVKKEEPRKFPFRNMIDFLSVPFVKEFQGREHFIGFTMTDTGVSLVVQAYFSDGEFVTVGRVVNRIGIESLPTPEALLNSLEEADKAKGNGV